MRFATLLASTLALSVSATAQWTENFESYASGQQLSNVGGWFGWDNTAAAAGTVDSQRSRSFPNSLRVTGTTDAVHPALGATSGKWRMTAWQYIAAPMAHDIYFILNNVYNHGGPYSWTVELQCDVTTGMVIDDLRAHTPIPIAFDRWAEYRLDIDLDLNTISSYYDGKLVSTGTYASSGPKAIANIDLFSTGGVCNFDDISLGWVGDAFDTYAPATVLSNVGGWFGWDNTPAAAGSADATRFRSAPNSILVGSGGDAVHPNIGITSGRWIFTGYQYIASPLANDCYFIVNNRYNHGGPYNWAIEIQADVTTGMILDDLRPHTALPIAFNSWAEYRLDIDLDANWVKTYYNGALLSQGAWLVGGGPMAIANIDLFNNGGVCNWDDICFRKVTPPACFETNLGTALAMGDDQRVARPLGFTFPFPGGSTTDIGICSNGFIWLDGVQTSNDFSNSVAEFLGSAQATPRICACWRDFNPFAAGSDDVYYNAMADRVVITWHNVVRYNGTSPMTVQCQMFADGNVYVFFDANIDMTGGTAAEGRSLIGIKAPTGVVADPGNRDYSATLPASAGSTMYEFFSDSALFDLRGRCIQFSPNTTGGYDMSFRADCRASAFPYGAGCPAATPVTLASTTRPALGSMFTWNVTNVPAATTAAAMLLGLNTANVSLTPLGFVGCSAYTTMDLAVALPFTPPTASLTAMVPIQPQLIGRALQSQAAIVENFNAGPVTTSNGLTLLFGKD